MSFSRFLAGWVMAAYTLGTCLQLMGPVVAGPLPEPPAIHSCPTKLVIHGVGKDLKSYQRTLDRCSGEGMARR